MKKIILLLMSFIPLGGCNAPDVEATLQRINELPGFETEFVLNDNDEKEHYTTKSYSNDNAYVQLHPDTGGVETIVFYELTQSEVEMIFEELDYDAKSSDYIQKMFMYPGGCNSDYFEVIDKVAIRLMTSTRGETDNYMLAIEFNRPKFKYVQSSRDSLLETRGCYLE